MSEKKDREENTKVDGIKFFSDQPLTADRLQEIRFGHLDIADNLRQIVVNCPLPFTVGLFGKWGSGKTTILNILRKRLDDVRMAVVNFDVWKHEADALRRTFLKESVKQLKSKDYLPQNFRLTERIEKSLRKTMEGKVTWTRRGKLTLLGFVGLIVVLGVVFAILLPAYIGSYLSTILGGGLVLTVFLWLLQHAITSETLTTTFDRFRDPHEFEKEFEKVTNGIDSERTVFVIDNLDRCNHDKAVELLSTIKTFLAKDTDTSKSNKCIFLIACDDEAIKKHIQSVYQNTTNSEEPFSADEFLRKFFNTFVRIPDFINTELQTYTENLLKQTRISALDSSDVAHVISSAFRENPRQIKQFINGLIARFLLAQRRENAEEPSIVPQGTITDNVAYLAKFLVIEQQYPSPYKRIRESQVSLEELGNVEKDKKFKKFLRATKAITAPDIRPFIYLKQSEEELAIPGIKELELGLMDDDREIVEKRLETLKENPKQFSSLKKLIPSLIDRNKGRRLPLLNIISCSLYALQHHNLELKRDFYDKIADMLNDEDALKPDFLSIEPSLVFKEVLKRCNRMDKNGIITQYITILEKQSDKKEPELPEGNAYTIFKELLEHKDWLTKDNKKGIKHMLAELYFPSVDILSLFIKDQREFISEETLSKFVGTFSNDDIENTEKINAKFNLLLNFQEIVTPPIAQNVIERMNTLLKDENEKPYRDEKENLLSRIEEILNTFHKQIMEIEDQKTLDAFADSVTHGINALGDLTQKRIFVFTCLELVDLLKDETRKSNINTLIQNFFSKADITGIDFVLKKLISEKKAELVRKYKEIFGKKALQQQPIFDLLYPIAPPEIRIQWLINMINAEPTRATQKLKELHYKVDDKRKIVEALLAKAKSAIVQEKALLYEAINKMRCADSQELRSKFASQIKTLLKNADQNLQKVGYDTLQSADYLSSPVKREITRETVEWLRSLEPPKAGQPYSVRSIMLDRKVLESLRPVQQHYIDFVFDKLIKRGINIENIRLGFEVLLELKPRYEDYGVLFEDTLYRAKSEGNNAIKTELKSGLLKLKPKTLSKKNKDFWEMVEKLS